MAAVADNLLPRIQRPPQARCDGRSRRTCVAARGRRRSRRRNLRARRRSGRARRWRDLDGTDAGRALEFDEGEAVVAAIMGGAGLAFFGLIGFEDSVNMAEETRDPRRAYPRALFGGLLIAGAIYLLVTLVASVVRTKRGSVRAVPSGRGLHMPSG